MREELGIEQMLIHNHAQPPEQEISLRTVMINQRLAGIIGELGQAPVRYNQVRALPRGAREAQPNHRLLFFRIRAEHQNRRILAELTEIRPNTGAKLSY